MRSAKRRDLFLRILEETRRKYRFVVHGYVVMPEHFHLLITEPEVGDPSVVMKVVKQRFARRLNQLRKRSFSAQASLWDSTPDPVWQKRFYDFNVWSESKRIEKLRYMHRNPVKRGLVEQPRFWNPTLFAKGAKKGGAPRNFPRGHSAWKCRTTVRGSDRPDTMKNFIPLSKKWASYLVSLPETGMGYQVISVFLNDGRQFDQVVVDSGHITRVRGHKDIPFAESDIAEIKVTHDKWNWKEDDDSQ